MKATLAILTSVLLLQCANRNKEAANSAALPALSLVEATGQKWTAGIQGGGSGIEYTYTVAVNSSETLSIDRVVMADAVYTPVITRPGAPIGQPVNPQQGDTLLVRVSVPGPGATPATNATIHYALNGDARTLEVQSITMLPPLNRP